MHLQISIGPWLGFLFTNAKKKKKEKKKEGNQNLKGIPRGNLIFKGIFVARETFVGEFSSGKM